MLSRASRDAHLYDRKRFAEVALPWASLHEDSAKALDELIVSHRVDRKINGQIHKETNYGFDEIRGGTQRIEVGRLSAKQVECILDPGVQARVKARLKELNETEPGKAFKEPKNHPFLIAKDGREIPIHKVTILVGKPDLEIGEGFRMRFADSAGNHHYAIFELDDGKGGVRWEGRMVTQYEAMRRHSRQEPVVSHEQGFRFTLSNGDTIRYEEEGLERFGWVRSVMADGRIGFSPNRDAREKDQQRKDGAFQEKSLRQCQLRNMQKMSVDALGRARIARD